MGEQVYSSTCSHLRHYIDVACELHSSELSPRGKSPLPTVHGSWMISKFILDPGGKQKFLAFISLECVFMIGL
jgi:hypothetical protein